jgi:hypothetical protein
MNLKDIQFFTDTVKKKLENYKMLYLNTNDVKYKDNYFKLENEYSKLLDINIFTNNEDFQEQITHIKFSGLLY